MNDLDVLIRETERRELRMRLGAAAMLVTVIGGTLLVGWRLGGPWGVPWALLLLVGNGGLAWGYAAKMVVLLRAGMVHATREAWQVEMVHERIYVRHRGLEAAVDLDEIESARWIVDGDFDGLKGIEEVLDLRLRRAGRLRIPESARGFHPMRASLEKRIRVGCLMVE